MKVLGGMLIGGTVAASDVAAGETESQMHPSRSDFQAILAALGGWGDLLDPIEMFAHGGHANSWYRKLGVHR